MCPSWTPSCPPAEKILADAGHTQALQKTREEYRKYQEAALSPVEQAYLETIKETGEAVKQELKRKETSSPDP